MAIIIPCDVLMKCNRTGPNPGLRAGGVETGNYPGLAPRARTPGLHTGLATGLLPTGTHPGNYPGHAYRARTLG